MFGSGQAIAIGDKFYEYLTTNLGLASKPALEGVSRGGLFVYNWAAKNADKVACIYCDTPVCDFNSWPAGKGDGLGSAGAWAQCLKAYGLNEDEALRYDQNPVDNLAPIAKAKIPILHIVSENDEVVPPHENTYLLQKRLEQHGHPIEVISVPKGTAKSNGHHFDHPAPGRVVSFVSQHAGAFESSRLDLLRRARRIVFLGDSITYAGHYVAYFDAWLLAQKLETAPVVIDVGLPSETVSGLSEDGHAGGKFPRPDLAERLDRVLAITQPDLVFACYGINCGIYQPFDEEHFSRYQYGVRTLKQKVEAAGATLVLITPPAYDDQRARKPFSYNAVLDRYAEWLLSQRKQVWLVVNLHGPMTAEVAERRITNPEFTFQPDAVHPNSAGHWFMASQLIRWFGDEQAANADSPDKTLTAGVMMLIRQRIRVRRDAYLGEAGHKRPGIKRGLQVPEAENKAEELSIQLCELLKATP
jgi:lysophospholipase L1-like esterase